MKLQKEFGDQVACITVSGDNQSTGGADEVVKKEVLPKLKELGMTTTNVVTHEDADSVMKRFEVSFFPTVLVYDRTGKLARRFNNDNAQTEAEYFTYRDVTAKVQELLK